MYDKDAKAAMQQAKEILSDAVLNGSPHDGQAATRTNILLTAMIRAVMVMLPSDEELK